MHMHFIKLKFNINDSNLVKYSVHSIGYMNNRKQFKIFSICLSNIWGELEGKGYLFHRRVAGVIGVCDRQATIFPC